MFRSSFNYSDKRVHLWFVLIPVLIITYPFSSVLCQPVIEVNPLEIDFGSQILDSTVSEEIVITNNGDELLVIESIDLESEAFRNDFGADDLQVDHFIFDTTENQHDILIEESYWDEEVLIAGMEVGLFTPEGVCGGGKVVENNGDQVGFVAYGNENDEEPNGFEDEEEFEFRIWDPATDVEVVAEAEFSFGPETYTDEAFSVVTINAEGGSHRYPDGTVHLIQNGTATIVVYFTPTEIGNYEANLVITSNDQDNRQVTVELTGRGSAEGGPPVIREPSADGEFAINRAEGEEFEIIFLATDPIDMQEGLAWTLQNQHDLPDENGETWSFADSGSGTARFQWSIDYASGRDEPYMPLFRVTDQDEDYAEIMLIITVEDLSTPPPELIPDQMINEDAQRTILFDPDDLFEDGENSGFSFSLVINPEQLGLQIDDRTNEVSAEPVPDFCSPEPGIEAMIRAVNQADLSYDMPFQVIVNPINDPPGEFRILEPEHNRRISIDSETVHFAWELSEQNEYEIDEIGYQVVFINMYGQGPDSLISPVVNSNEYDTNLAAVMDSFLVDVSSSKLLLWYVIAVDDSEQVQSSNGPFIIIAEPSSVKKPNLPGVPAKFLLLPAYPNPFNNMTKIRFGIPSAGNVYFMVVNMRGEMLSDMIENRFYPAGYHTLDLEMNDLPAGSYLMKIEFGGKILTQNVVLVK